MAMQTEDLITSRLCPPVLSLLSVYMYFLGLTILGWDGGLCTSVLQFPFLFHQLMISVSKVKMNAFCKSVKINN